MALPFYAGQILYPDDLMNIQWHRVSQGAAQPVVSSTTLIDSAIVIPVEGLTSIKLFLHYTSLGGGIKWDWNVSAGSVSDADGRWVWGHGQATTGDVLTSTALQMHRSSMTTDRNVQHFTSQSPNAMREELTVTGSGELTLRFAQDTSNANATTLAATTYARYLRLEP
ncbi:hypothetical protein [Streptomyces sp. TRM68416]|uniref:hypothetical protein n=1 Tax=Streptomyces sp. TRM68416 TaxID=2758412 RepID=UPI001661F139|nr:hypothetical protein [Streptomyces sp. TRM68416]MBD0838776.1 hypothetical protein [Streptomyces sp. TRM68416]